MTFIDEIAHLAECQVEGHPPPLGFSLAFSLAKPTGHPTTHSAVFVLRSLRTRRGFSLVSHPIAVSGSRLNQHIRNAPRESMRSISESWYRSLPGRSLQAFTDLRAAYPVVNPVKPRQNLGANDWGRLSRICRYSALREPALSLPLRCPETCAVPKQDCPCAARWIENQRFEGALTACSTIFGLEPPASKRR